MEYTITFSKSAFTLKIDERTFNIERDSIFCIDLQMRRRGRKRRIVITSNIVYALTQYANTQLLPGQVKHLSGNGRKLHTQAMVAK